MKLLEIYADEGNIQKSLVATVKLTVYHERWYHEIVVSCLAGWLAPTFLHRTHRVVNIVFSSLQYPTSIAFNLNKLIRTEGLSKMQNMLISMNLPQPVFKLVTRFFTWAETFRVDGSEF